ncbi:hypothetical protein HDU98_005044, partial [Podochytrium sp. JEL0797]
FEIMTSADFATAWLHAWNTHNLPLILSHYSEDIEFTSPLAAKLTNDPTGIVRGKKALAAYWEKGLAAHPDLQFEIISVCFGVSGVVSIVYKSLSVGKVVTE